MEIMGVSFWNGHTGRERTLIDIYVIGEYQCRYKISNYD